MIIDGKLIHLNRVQIYGFQSINRFIDISFAEGNISIIFGNNGSGKTTFLKILNAIFKQDNSILYNENVNEIYLEYKIKDLSIEIEEEYTEKIKINFIDNGDNYAYDWNEYIDSPLSDSKSLSLGIERGITTSSLKISEREIIDFLRHPKYRKQLRDIDEREFSEDFVKYLKEENNRMYNRYHKRNELSLEDNHAYLQNIKIKNIEELLLERYRKARGMATKQIQNALFETLSFVFEDDNRSDLENEFVLDDKFNTLLITSKNRIIEALDDGFEQNKFKKEIINKLLEIKSINDIPKIISNKLFYKLIKNMIQELEFEKLLLGVINSFVENFNKFLDKDKKLVINSDDVYIDIRGEKFNISVLSSGERHVFTFLSLIIVDGNLRDFVFIDEPEISLNIKWQRILMGLLKELAPYTQIIVASHSPMIAKNLPNALIELKPGLINEL